jgi:hypothetical protein
MAILRKKKSITCLRNFHWLLIDFGHCLPSGAKKSLSMRKMRVSIKVQGVEQLGPLSPYIGGEKKSKTRR